MRIAGSRCGHLRCEHGGERVLVGRRVEAQHARDALQLRCLRRDGLQLCAEEGDVHRGALDGLRAAYAAGSGLAELPSVVFADDEYGGHQMSPFAVSAATSSLTSLTITPFTRAEGG